MPDTRYSHNIRVSDPTGAVPGPSLRVVLRAIRDAEVLYIAFPRLQRALVIDPRHDESDYPAALVATLAFGTWGQAKAVENLRPDRTPSARAIATTWGGSVRAFAEQGVLAAIVARLPAADEQSVIAAFEQLQEAEREPAPSRQGPVLPS